MSLRDDLRGGVLYGAGFSVIALLIIAGAAVRTLFGARIGGWSQLPLALPVIIGSYLGAGLLGGLGFWATRPLRRWAVGWALSGFAIGTIVYGTVALTGILAYLYFDVNLFDLKSKTDAWQFWPAVSLVCGALTGVPLGLYYWSQERSSGRTETNWRFLGIVVAIAAILALAMRLAGWW